MSPVGELPGRDNDLDRATQTLGTPCTTARQAPPSPPTAAFRWGVCIVADPDTKTIAAGKARAQLLNKKQKQDGRLDDFGKKDHGPFMIMVGVLHKTAKDELLMNLYTEEQIAKHNATPRHAVLECPAHSAGPSRR